MSKFYTKTGDRGKTGLRGGERCNKADPRVEAIGAVDELGSIIAVAIVEVQSSPPAGRAGKFKVQNRKTITVLTKIQGDLFHIGAVLSGEKKDKEKRVEYLKERVEELEQEIDKIQKGLPAQKGFVLSGGTKPSAYLDFSRTVCRRAERRAVVLLEVDRVIVKPDTILHLVKYLNRLSDYLYALARLANYKFGKDEIKWKSNFYSFT